MKEFTQSNTDPGNCWQTAIACVLEVDPSTLPDQVLIERSEKRLFDGWLSYNNALQGYLGKHHGLRYIENQAWQLAAMGAKPGFHIICGPTVRTPGHRARVGGAHIHHCVVARDGVPVWDVHPSRAGLTEPHEWRWGCLVSPPKELVAEWHGRGLEDPDYRRVFIDCVCPACFDQTGIA